MPQMIIANRLADGVVVFFDAASAWVESIDEAALVEDEPAGAELLARAKRDEEACVVIDPRLIDVEIVDGRRQPTDHRERVRASGPTVRTDLMHMS